MRLSRRPSPARTRPVPSLHVHPYLTQDRFGWFEFSIGTTIGQWPNGDSIASGAAGRVAQALFGLEVQAGLDCLFDQLSQHSGAHQDFLYQVLSRCASLGALSRRLGDVRLWRVETGGTIAMRDIAEWLEAHGLGEHVDACRENGIGLDVLAELAEDDLRELGFNLGDRRRFRAALRAGQPQLAEAAPSGGRTAPARPEAERRQLTVMFCDLVGSTALSESMDPEQYRELLTAYQSAAHRALTGHGGYIARYMGDGLLVYFGYPQANEDDAERAVRGGLAVVTAVTDLYAARPLEVRIGIATGLVVAGDIVGEGASEERAVLGDTPNLAARLQGEAGPNEVVISQVTQRLVQGRFTLMALPSRALKGLSTPVTAYRATGEARGSRFEAATVRGLTRYVGRATERETLARCLSQAAKGRGQIVFVGGEPGIGKSRLIADLMGRASGYRVRRYQCSSQFVNTPLHPVTEILVRSSDSAQDLNGLAGCLPPTVARPDEALWLLGSLLGMKVEEPGGQPMTPDLQKQRTLDLLGEIAIGAETDPVILLVEDVHWADASTLEWLGVVMNGLEHRNRLLILSFRPAFEPEWKPAAAVTELTLSRLTAKDGRRIAAEVTGGRELPESVLDEILD